MSTTAFDQTLRQWRGVDLERDSRGEFTQAEAAEYLGAPLKTYQDWEQGRRTPALIVQSLLAPKLLKKPKAKRK